MNFVHATNLSHSKVKGEIVISSSAYDEWNEKMDKFWEIDSLGILPSVYDCFEYINNRYEVKLPFKENIPMIENNYMNSVTRLKSLKRKLGKTPEIFAAYNMVIKQQLHENVVEKVNKKGNEPVAGTVTYLPHRAVFREDNRRN